MSSNLTNIPNYRFTSKNSRYLDPHHKELAKQSFEQERRIKDYYSFQSKIYDASRWSFLFGRRQLVNFLPYKEQQNFNLLEVGCGTGFNLKQIQQKYPKANLVGLDVSKKMLSIAERKVNKVSPGEVQLLHTAYDDKTQELLPNRPQIILFSYALTMINPQWKDLILQCKKDLTAIGYIAVVDFHHSPHRWFRRHMKNHHVRMDGHLLPFLRSNFEPIHESIHNAYFGLWQYFTFVGKLID